MAHRAEPDHVAIAGARHDAAEAPVHSPIVRRHHEQGGHPRRQVKLALPSAQPRLVELLLNRLQLQPESAVGALVENNHVRVHRVGRVED